MKYLYVKFSDATYRIPAEVIAKDRASYFATHDTNEVTPQDDPEWQRIYKEELEYTMDDDLELIDYASNNLNWDDVAHHAEKVEKPIKPPDYEAEWTNAKKSVKNVK